MDDEPKTVTGEEDRQTAARILLEARKLISTPQTWTRRAFARDRHSHPVSPTSDRAVRFCVGGALIRAAGEAFDFDVTLSTNAPALVPPLSLLRAYQRLGETMAALLLEPDALEITGKDWTTPAVRRQIGEGRRRRAVIEETDWPSIVHTLNNHKAVSYGAVRVCLHGALVAELVKGRGDQSFDIHRWLDAMLGEEREMG